MCDYVWLCECVCEYEAVCVLVSVTLCEWVCLYGMIMECVWLWVCPCVFILCVSYMALKTRTIFTGHSFLFQPSTFKSNYFVALETRSNCVSKHSLPSLGSLFFTIRSSSARKNLLFFCFTLILISNRSPPVLIMGSETRHLKLWLKQSFYGRLFSSQRDKVFITSRVKRLNLYLNEWESATGRTEKISLTRKIFR